METFSALLALPLLPQASDARFDVFFDLRPNKRLSKQPWGWWFETPSLSLWRQCNDAKAISRQCSLQSVMRIFQSDLAIIDYGNISLHWRHNGRDSVSYHQPHDCLLNRLFRRRSKKTSKLGPVNSPHNSLVMRKMFPIDDVIMIHLFDAKPWFLEHLAKLFIITVNLKWESFNKFDSLHFPQDMTCNYNN